MLNKRIMIPKIRFSDFKNKWNTTELEKVSSIVMGQSPSGKNYTNNPSDFILVQGNADMKDGLVVPRVWTTEVTRMAKKGSLILSVRAPVGEIGKTDFDVVLGRGVSGIEGNEFIYQSLIRMKSSGYWTRYSTGSTFESINSKSIKEAVIFMPESKEQDKIGEFFKQLDNIITLQQQLLDDYKQLKKAMLQKMFPKKGESIPRVRFTEFNNEWVQKKLGEIYEKSSYRNKDLEYGKEKIISVSKMRFKDTISKSDDDYMKTYNVLKRDEIAFEGNKSKNYKYGRFVLNDIGDGIVSHVFIVMKPKVILPSNFIKEYINNENIMQKILLFSTTSTLMMTSLNSKEFLKQKIKLPSFKEQEKIGNFFKQLDETIVLHEKKLETYQNLKKAMLQKMFV